MQLTAVRNAVVLMTEAEARQAVTDIRVGLVSIGDRLLELYEREGWRALGYDSWRECAQAELGFRQSHVYRLLDAARVERNISPIGENALAPNEFQARPLTQLEPEDQRVVWQRVIEESHGNNGKITGATVQRMVEKVKTPHVSHNSGNNEWYTPPEYITAANAVMGGIDLDPASSEIANRTVGAAAFYTEEDDGLCQSWGGRVWMNPPYASSMIGSFAEKLAFHVKRGDVSEACVLVNNATETGWFNAILNVASCVCFIRSRVRFVDMHGNPSGAPLQGQALLYIGDKIEAFALACVSFGTVLYARQDPE